MSRFLPGLGLEGFWPLGFDGWNTGMDTNLRLCSALIQARALDLVSAEPGSPSDGDIYLLDETHATHPNGIAVRDNGAWVYLTTQTGWKFYDVAAGSYRKFNGTVWAIEAIPTVDDDETMASGSATDAPSVRAAKAYVDAAVAAVSGSGGAVPDGVVSGCGIAYSGTGLTFNMSSGSFIIDGALHTAAAQSITLAAADATNPRIDVLYVDDTGTLGKITGTAAANPSQPAVDPTTQLYLTFVLVPATATSLSGITNEAIYQEGSEWTGSTSGTGFTIGSTNNPYGGTKDIEGTSVAAGAYAKFVRSSAISFDGNGNLTLQIRSKATWNSRRWLTLQWFAASVAKGSPVNLKSGTFGFDSSITSGYQLIVIPKTQFAVPAGTSVDELRVTDVGGAIGFYIDDIILQNTGSTSGSGGTTSGISQDQADARYAQRSLSLADLGSASAARGNLGLGSAAIAATSDFKAATPNVQSVSSAATVTPTFSNDGVKVTAQAAGLTLANPSGTAVSMWGWAIRIKDNGTARSISFGTQYRAVGVTLPTTTVVGKTLYLGCIWNNDDSKVDVVAVAQEA